MKTLKLLKFISLIICFFVLSTIGEASAATYYIAPNGSNSNNGTSQSAPWATFDHAMGNLNPGDTLYLMDGVYNPGNQPENIGVLLYILNWPTFTGGTEGSPVTFKALNDGEAIIDGEGDKVPCKISLVI